MLKPLKPVLTVADASLSYGKLRALDGVSFDLCEGELLGLLGPNGAGKSSLIRCIAGRQKLDGGIITTEAGERESTVGVVPQEIAVYQDLTVRQNLSLFGQLHRVAPEHLRDRVDAALEWADLHNKHRTLARKLSGGMQRRLNIACSVLHQPAILLLDEPTVGVDPQSRERIYDMIQSLLEDGTSVLLTTHHLDEAQNRCDRIAIIDHGKIIDSGTFDELVARTTGKAQQISVRFTIPPFVMPRPLMVDAATGEAHGRLNDIGAELPLLLQKLNAGNAHIESVTLRGPTLQSVFLQLTGRELRE